MDNRQLRLKALGDYLKSRRARISPGSTGLPEGHTQRRKPGLKREEAALLAGVSTTWYTWLEQGRDIHVSREVLISIARALRLNEDEALHMLGLARLDDPVPLAPAEDVPAALLHLMNELPNPAIAVNGRSEVLAWNGAAEERWVDFSTVPPQERSMIRQFFFNSVLRTKIANWDDCAKYSVAAFRPYCDKNSGDPWVRETVHELMDRSVIFKEMWELYEVRNKAELVIYYTDGAAHEVTSLRYVQGNSDIHLIVCTPFGGQKKAIED